MEKFLIKNIKIQKIFIALIIFTVLIPTFSFFLNPQKVEAQWIVSDPPQTAIGIKDLAGQAFKQLKMIVAKKILNAMTQRTINWINSGFHGNPFYLENTEAFFKDIVKYEVRNLVDVYAYNKDKFPFGRQFALNTINAYQRNLEDNTAYTLSKVISDPVYLESYRNDFNVGGWNGFLINTQYPQNNYIGFTMLATEDLARKLDGTTMTAAQKVQDTLQKSQGFLAPKKCLDVKADGKTPTGYNNGKNEFVQPTWTQSKEYQDINKKYNCGEDIPGVPNICKENWEAELAKAKATWAETNTCKNLAVTTPGVVVADQIMTATTTKFRQSELGQAVGNSLTAVFDALMNKLVGDGLKKLSGVVESDKADTFDFKSGIKGGGSTGNNQICVDICLSNGNNADQCGTSCINGPTGGGGGTDPLSFFPTETGSTPTNPTNPPTGGPCTGNNPKCTCAEGVATYDVYAGAVSEAESRAYPNGLPAGTNPRTAQTAVCAAYTGPGTCRPASQEDELIIEGLPAPYVTLSIDFLAGNPYYLGSHAVAACEAGVQ